jgi:outer membrane protein TolC
MQQAAEAAQQNLDLVSDAYARGAVSIIQLLDAQTAHLNSQTQSANAYFQFLSDVMEVERSAGHFLLLAPREERDALIERLGRWSDEPQNEE